MPPVDRVPQFTNTTSFPTRLPAGGGGASSRMSEDVSDGDSVDFSQAHGSSINGQQPRRGPAGGANNGAGDPPAGGDHINLTPEQLRFLQLHDAALAQGKHVYLVASDSAARIEGPNGNLAMAKDRVNNMGNADKIASSANASARKILLISKLAAAGLGTAGVGMMIGYLISEDPMRKRMYQPYGGGYGVGLY